jgi:hypothetical protein
MDGRIEGLELITRNWPERYGLYPEVIQTIWKDKIGLEPKLKRVTDLIDSLVAKGNSISLIGTSASGSLMLNAFVERKGVVEKVINVGGFLRPGNEKGYRSFDERGAASIAFRESVLRFAKLESTLTAEDKKKILTVRPYWDELVPPETVVIKGALNKKVPMVEHVLGIATAMILYDPVVMFLKTSR